MRTKPNGGRGRPFREVFQDLAPRGKTYPQTLVHPDDRQTISTELRSLAQGARTVRFENRCRSRDGGGRWLSWMAVPEDGLSPMVARDLTAESAPRC